MICDITEQTNGKISEDYDKLLNMSDDEKSTLISSFPLSKVMDSEPDLDLPKLNRLFRRHLITNYGFPEYIMYPQFEMDDDEEENEDRLRDLASELLNGMNKEWIRLENVKITEQIPICVDWALTNGLKSVTQGDVEVYLDHSGIRLSKKSRRDLWTKVKFSLRKS